MKIIELLNKSVSYSVIMENMALERVLCLISTKQRENPKFLPRNGGNGHEKTSQSDEG